MIAYIEGKLMKKQNDRIVLLAGPVGYEILLPGLVMESIQNLKTGAELSLYIYFHQTERQPRPVLIGFNNEKEREFFQDLISVDAIGPLKAVQAFSMPVEDISKAIELKDIKQLSKLKAIGNRTAQKIVATLHGKMGKYVTIDDENFKKLEKIKSYPSESIINQVLEVLVNQLGYRMQEANQLIQNALSKNTKILTPEELLEEVYRGDNIS